MLRTIFLFTLVVFSSSLVNAQNAPDQKRVPASEKAIPKIVLETFKEQYPQSMLRGWFVTHITYWQQDISSGWYTDWYGNVRRTTVVYTYEQPNHFEVEFIDSFGALSRAVYNRYGYWFETRSQLKGLPMACLNSLADSKYKDWKRSKLTERIESAEWPESVYRFAMSKGLRYHIIRMNEQGEIVQVKYVEDED